MALPTKTTISTLQFSGDGSPWCDVAAKAAVNLDALEYSLDGSPWWGIEDASASNPIKSVTAVTWAAIKKIGGIILANIKKIGGVSTT